MASQEKGSYERMEWKAAGVLEFIIAIVDVTIYIIYTPSMLAQKEEGGRPSSALVSSSPYVTHLREEY